jgi:hypothetical protein
MDGMWIQNIIAVIAIFLIPMTGLTIILTSRLAFKPLVETLSKALRESGLATSPELLDQVRLLSEQVDALADQIHRLEEAQTFDRKLLETPREQAEILG